MGTVQTLIIIKPTPVSCVMNKRVSICPTEEQEPKPEGRISVSEECSSFLQLIKFRMSVRNISCGAYLTIHKRQQFKNFFTRKNNLYFYSV